MRILIIHNKYQQAGGEDAVVQAEYDLLRTRHDVQRLIFDNDAVSGLAAQASMAKGLFDNPEASSKVLSAIQEFKPDIVHVHNVWYAAGPSILRTVHAAGVPLVQTLHNYRQVCLNGMLTLEGKTCTRCLSLTLALPGILNRCNKGSYLTSATVAGALAWHRKRGTFTLPNKIICLTEHQHQLMLASGIGFGPDQLVLKPNFAEDPYLALKAEQEPERQDFLLFAGRLTAEKGAHLLPLLADAGYRILVAGTGDLEQSLRQHAASNPNLVMLGWQTEAQVTELMLQARALLLLSTWHEGLPVVLVKAFGAGLPILTAKNPNLSTLVTDGYNGICVDTNQPNEVLSGAARIMQSHLWKGMSDAARQTYLDLYTPAKNLMQLEQIYAEATQQA